MHNKGCDSHPISIFEDIEVRIRIAIENLLHLSEVLDDHADRVQGSNPPATEENRVSGEYGTGQLGDIFRALETLDASVNRVAKAAARNTGLA